LKRLPNILTVGRFVLMVPFFWMLSLGDATVAGALSAWDVALVLFLLAGLTDVLDGWIARRYDAKTTLGRVLDPAADKVLVCGALVYFAALPAASEARVPAWIVVVILARELTVNALRGVAESLGHAYPGSAWGKVKMAVESVTLTYLILYAGHLTHRAFAWALFLFDALLYLMVVVVVASGLQHVVRSVRLIRATRPGFHPPTSTDARSC